MKLSKKQIIIKTHRKRLMENSFFVDKIKILTEIYEKFDMLIRCDWHKGTVEEKHVLELVRAMSPYCEILHHWNQNDKLYKFYRAIEQVSELEINDIVRINQTFDFVNEKCLHIC